jgi:hypothetical protein
LDNTVFDAWQSELQSLGYPSLTRNIAISNGSFCGNQQDYDYNASLLKIDGKANTGLLADMVGFFLGFSDDFFLAFVTGELSMLVGVLPGSSKFDIDFNARALPQAGSSANIYSGKIEYIKKLYWLVDIPITLTETNVNAFANLSYDVYPGGREELFNIVDDIIYFDDIDYGDDGNADFTQFQADMINFLAGSADIDFTTEETFGFIPNVSALDVGGIDPNDQPPLDLDYFRSYNVNDNDVNNNLGILFDNFISAYINNNSANEEHISFNTRNGNWLALELDNQLVNEDEFDCSFACELDEIGGVDRICSDSPVSYTFSLPDGADNYQWSVFTNGIAEINSPLNTNSISITWLGDESGFINMSVIVNAIGCDILNRTLTKQVYLGEPTVSSVVPGNDVGLINPITNPPFGCEVLLKLNFQPNDNEPVELEYEKISSADWSLTYLPPSVNGKYFYVYPQSDGLFEFRVRSRGACGTWSQWQDLSYNITKCEGGSSGSDSLSSDNFIISPVPADDEINVSVIQNPSWPIMGQTVTNPGGGTVFDAGNGSSGTTSIDYSNTVLQVSFYNNSGIVVLSTQTMGGYSPIDISALVPGSYVMVIGYQSYSESHIITVN